MDPRPRVLVRKGRIHETADEAEDALIQSGQRFYARGQVLVRLAFGETRDDLRRADMQPCLIPVTPPMLIEAFERAACFESAFKQRDGNTQMRPVGCPPTLPSVYLGRVGGWRLPNVRGLCLVPMLREDRTLVFDGYDGASGALVLAGEAASWGEIPTQPTRAEAEAALAPLRALLAGFPFVTPADESACIAAMLSSVLRPALPTSPGFAFSAPVAGSGKSKLCDVCSVLATGRAAPAMTWAPREEESEKRLGAALLEADPVLLLDNIDCPLKSDALNSAITQETVSIRLLGQSSMVSVQARTQILASGNNLIIAGDLRRRFIRVEIDPQMERPELRPFEFDPVEYAKAHRRQLVRALLTIAAWGLDVPQQATPLGSFERWSRRVRDPLLALGLADPSASMDSLWEDDPERQQAVELVSEWRRAFAGRAVTVADAIAAATSSTDPNPSLRAALDAVAGGPGGINPRRLGRYLLRHKARQFGRLVIEQRRDFGGNVAAWRVDDRSEASARTADYRDVRG